jgi:hypothetical protein
MIRTLVHFGLFVSCLSFGGPANSATCSLREEECAGGNCGEAFFYGFRWPTPVLCSAQIDGFRALQALTTDVWLVTLPPSGSSKSPALRLIKDLLSLPAGAAGGGRAARGGKGQRGDVAGQAAWGNTVMCSDLPLPSPPRLFLFNSLPDLTASPSLSPPLLIHSLSLSSSPSLNSSGSQAKVRRRKGRPRLRRVHPTTPVTWPSITGTRTRAG